MRCHCGFMCHRIHIVQQLKKHAAEEEETAERDSGITRASTAALALKSARILHAARAFCSARRQTPWANAERSGVCAARVYYLRAPSFSLTFPNAVLRDHGRERATPRAGETAVVLPLFGCQVSFCAKFFTKWKNMLFCDCRIEFTDFFYTFIKVR